ncbi:hypothetical protein ERO13_A13G139200v2 [Gossypium hirsutum]|uniref:Septum-promoting GTP-binding protein 1 n=2 Tax=Gossypium TaxID=3633 RepID=A0A1U8I741_GOSHI|nr:septum-promoting GTP-binding protein 1-like [Gossypium hirsutum]KAG4166539.1 hypothetical protein ERO13_A13G139200v2 [Gossypium hirsutum]TYG86841.1 hypothetical protein ES288_A13G165000v1 [Gossypium darwinii]
MTLPSMKTVHLNTKWGILERVSIFRRFFSFLWDKILVCSIARPIQYRRLTRPDSSSSSSSPVEVVVVDDNKTLPEDHPPMICNGNEADSDLVSLKISLLGDCQIGKTSFLVKYVGDEQEKSLRMTGLNLVNKTLFVQGARIAFSIWDVGGDSNSLDLLPIACKNAVAILFMFDLTSRCTLNGVVGWYSQARKWNQTAIPILVGTKFDDFVGLPPDLQWTIVTQARAYARAMNATLFFSSATHNINVNKIFKFIMAKLFNLPWTVERNLTIGEPIIDF